MSTETPEQVALTPPTPELIAESLTEGDHDYHDGNDWWPSITADGNVVRIGITPVGTHYETKLPEVHFEAHVFKVEPSPPVASEPVELTVEDARDLAFVDVGDGFDGWTVVDHRQTGSSRWRSSHRLVIRNEAGEHFAAYYRKGLTENQHEAPWEYDKVARFEPVERRVRVVQSYEWATPAAQVEQSSTTGGA